MSMGMKLPVQSIYTVERNKLRTDRRLTHLCRWKNVIILDYGSCYRYPKTGGVLALWWLILAIWYPLQLCKKPMVAEPCVYHAGPCPEAPARREGYQHYNPASASLNYTHGTGSLINSMTIVLLVDQLPLFGRFAWRKSMGYHSISAINPTS
ncbi:hypothetical protein BJX96DRAFT_93624 [Aspergillus floccosus]